MENSRDCIAERDVSTSLIASKRRWVCWQTGFILFRGDSVGHEHQQHSTVCEWRDSIRAAHVLRIIKLHKLGRSF